MGKYFKKKIRNRKRSPKYIMITTSIIVIVSVIVIVLLILLFQNATKPVYEVKTDITYQLNDPMPSTKDLFNVYRNINEKNVTVNYNDFSTEHLGDYIINVAVTINDTRDDYTINVKVEDTTNPVLSLKAYTITEGEKYLVSDFIEYAGDNSGVTETSFTNSNYSNITEIGVHSISITAQDPYGNSVTRETTLTIKPVQTIPEPTPDPEPTPSPTCLFGSIEPSDTKLPITYNLLKDNNNCPMDVALVKENKDNIPEKFKSKIDKLWNDHLNDKLQMETSFIIRPENIKIIVTGIQNKEGIGIVGYNIQFLLYVDESFKITDPAKLQQEKYLKENFYLLEDGTRQYLKNDYNLK